MKVATARLDEFRRGLGTIQSVLLLRAALCGAALMLGASAGAAPNTVAMLVSDEDAGRVAVQRNHVTAPYDPTVGFLACDVAWLKPGRGHATTPVRILTIRHETVLLPEGGWHAECGSGGADSSAMGAWRELFTAVESRRVVVSASRAVECPNDSSAVAALDIPILPERVHTMLVHRNGSFFINWTPEFAPFSLEIAMADDGATVFSRAGIVTNELYIERFALPVGVYRMRLTDRCGRTVVDDHLELVNAALRPPIPSNLGSLGEPQRTLFYADYLASADEGQWALEGMQLVAQLRPRTQVVDDWLSRWKQ